MYVHMIQLQYVEYVRTLRPAGLIGPELIADGTSKHGSEVENYFKTERMPWSVHHHTELPSGDTTLVSIVQGFISCMSPRLCLNMRFTKCLM